MIGTLQREKIYEALAFFSANVRYAGAIKLFKLLYYLDLMHFRRTGRTVTGLDYEAWPMGPVPRELDEEFKDKRSDLHEHFEVEEYQKIEHYETPTIDFNEEDVEGGAFKSTFVPGSITPKTTYKHLYLTKREMGIASQLAEIFRDAKAEEMTDVSHDKFGPWRKALQKGKREGITRPSVDLSEGRVACGNPQEELPIEELKEILVERALIEEALG